MNPDPALNERRGESRLANQFGPRGNVYRSVEVHAAEHNAAVDRSRPQSDPDLLARMQADAGGADQRFESALPEHKCLWKLQFYARDGRGAPARRRAPPAPSVRLFAQERGNVVLIHPRLLQRLDSGSTVASNYRRRIELVVIDRAGQVVGSRLLRHHELRLGLPRRRRSP